MRRLRRQTGSILSVLGALALMVLFQNCTAPSPGSTSPTSETLPAEQAQRTAFPPGK